MNKNYNRNKDDNLVLTLYYNRTNPATIQDVDCKINNISERNEKLCH